MKKLKCNVFFMIVASGLMFSLNAFDKTAYPPPFVNIILDTDFSPDVDDVGALAMLHFFADEGICKILGVGVTCNPLKDPYAAYAVDVVNTFYKRPDIPIGFVKNSPPVPSLSDYTQQLTNQFPNDLKNTPLDQIPDAYLLYRQILANQPEDNSVVIVTIGFKTALSQLLNSEADDISPLNGVDLVAKKVFIVVDMGGAYPKGSEFNFNNNARATQNYVNKCPRPIVFTGNEIGKLIFAGSKMSSMTPVTNPVRKAYELHVGIGNGRCSWDLTAVLYACRGLQQYWSLHTTGFNDIKYNGANTWIEPSRPGYDHSYLVEKMSIAKMQDLFDSILVVPPRGDPNGSFISPKFSVVNQGGSNGQLFFSMHQPGFPYFSNNLITTITGRKVNTVAGNRAPAGIFIKRQVQSSGSQ